MFPRPSRTAVCGIALTVSGCVPFKHQLSRSLPGLCWPSVRGPGTHLQGYHKKGHGSRWEDRRVLKVESVRPVSYVHIRVPSSSTFEFHRPEYQPFNRCETGVVVAPASMGVCEDWARWCLYQVSRETWHTVGSQQMWALRSLSSFSIQLLGWILKKKTKLVYLVDHITVLFQGKFYQVSLAFLV